MIPDADGKLSDVLKMFDGSVWFDRDFVVEATLKRVCNSTKDIKDHGQQNGFR